MRGPSTYRAFLQIGLFAGLLLLVLGGPTQAQFGDLTRDVTKRGTTAAEFLTLPVGARATGMGNAITASVSDASSIYWNPAGMTGMNQGAFSLESAEWLAGINFNYASLILPFEFGTIGLGITSMRTPDMEVTTVELQNGTGETYTAGSYAVSLAYARQLTDRFSIGGAFKVINERIWNSSATGAAFDIGTSFVTPFRDIRLGASITNFGSKMRLAGDDLLVVVDIDPNNGGNNESNRALLKTDQYDLPLTMRIGLAGEVYQSEQARLTLAVDALNPNNSEQFVNVGAELGFLGDLLLIRGGYNELFLKDSLRSLALGAGLNYRFGSLSFSADYAYEMHQYFAGVNRFTVAVYLP